MKKRLTALLLAMVLVLGSSALAQGETADAGARVFDYAGLFTAEQADTLQAAIIDFQENTGYDFAILITTEDTGYDDYQQLADDFVAANALGLGMNHTAILCYLDLLGDGYYYISVYGDLKNMMVTQDIQYLIDTGLDYFYKSDFTGAFTWTMHMLTEALNNIGSVENTRVFDYAEVLADEDTQTLETAIAAFREKTDRDFLFLSTYEDLDGNEDGDYMQTFYSSHGFGAGDQQSGVIMYLDMFNGFYYIQNFGDLDSFVSQEALNEIMAQCTPLMSEGEIAQAVLLVIDAYAGHFE